jgi:hypothetical protein
MIGRTEDSPHVRHGHRPLGKPRSLTLTADGGHEADGPMTLVYACERARCPAQLTKNDTAGEVSFAGMSTLTNLVFRLLPNVNRTSFRLRQQYQK